MQVARRGPGRPETQVVAMAVLMVALVPVLLWATPDPSEAVEAGGWWWVVAIAVMFGLFEYTIFDVQFRREGIAFGLSEIPIAFALVFLAPVPALLSRLPLTVPILLYVRKNAPHKLAFNVALMLFELAIVILFFRSLLDWWGSGTATVIAAAVVATIAIAPITSMVISVAISRFEGGARERIVSELQATWWLYGINSVLAGMTIGLALAHPALSFLAILPALGVWFVLRSYGEVSQELRDLDAVHGFAGRVGRTLDVAEIGEVATADLVDLLRVDAVTLVRFTPEGPVVHSAGTVAVEMAERPDSAAWRDLANGAGARVVDAATIRRLGVSAGSAAHSALVAPIADESGSFALLMAFERDMQRRRFDDADIARMDNIADQLAVSLRRGMLHERLEFEARHDALTMLPARTLFERHVADAVAAAGRGAPAWVVMLDLDRFKEVNDTLGHHAGDDLLVQFADRMSRLLQPGDVLARLAGDEFAILGARASRAEVLELAQACVREGGRPVVLDGLEIVVTVSVGVAEVYPTDTDAVQPMRRADIAMYNAKWQRSGVEFYRDEIDRRTPARLSMLGDLRAAIETDQLDVVFQPKLELATRRVVGVEALVRWLHPTRGVVPPTEFVRVAEDTGLIKQLTDLVLVRGIRMLAEFDRLGLSIGLAVNLSTHDLFDSRLPDRVRAHLAANGVAPSALTLEITESSLFVDAPRTRATIDELHAVGARLAVDDFGTGYSSLSYLRKLPVHELKIDQSFVAGMLTDQQDEVIVKSTVDLGHNLGLKVVAEGVESLAVLERLGEIRCDIAQGFVISHPLASDELVGWLRRAADPSWRVALD
ncbi:MAG TPA: sensor domain-containing phosphodiesterase [Ilumatobacter sp.]